MKENFVPKMNLSSKEILFKEIRYGDIMYVDLEIENEGDGLLEFEIFRIVEKKTRAREHSELQNTESPTKKKKIEAAIPSWLNINPLRGVIKSGEKKTISFRVQVNQRECQLLFLYKDLQEWLEIRTNEPEHNNSQELLIKLDYLPSCFGAALTILNQCVGKEGLSIREELQAISFEDILLLMESKTLNEFTLPVPKELHKMVNFILQEGKLKPNIFLNTGNATQAKAVREKIDTN